MTPIKQDRHQTFCKAYLNQKPRTITNQLIFIKTVFNKAIKQGIVDVKYYPFGGDKIQIKIGTSNKKGLNIEEVKKLEALKLEVNSNAWHSLNSWLLSFYFAGINVSDVIQLRWSDFVNDRLLYEMNKNAKPVSLKIPDKANAILDTYKQYASVNNGYIFHFLNEAD
ncbi:phage integrase SAM-like domain-containing protein [Formosa sp. PL04]|uniref:phage integrase SAM-like domain-containing protein n=1 Tax=Formosa sp. PL04 TaxID=3081755 RepID=UPI0029810A94|nr:phage integrase SAM-like domain-containing protein [Formosa sp. PL04]MDW5290968.1 phage integrase SAM-like domain-containing protein [Formosa sp. PL04]